MGCSLIKSEQLESDILLESEIDDTTGAGLVGNTQVGWTEISGATVQAVLDDIDDVLAVRTEPFVARGDLLYRGATAPAILTVGTNTKFLGTDGTDPAWRTIGDLTADATPAGAADYVMTLDATDGLHKKVLLNNLPGGSSSPLTTKGDLFGYTTADARVPVSIVDGDILFVKSAETTGLLWGNISSVLAAPAGGADSGDVLLIADVSASSAHKYCSIAEAVIAGGAVMLAPGGTQTIQASADVDNVLTALEYGAGSTGQSTGTYIFRVGIHDGATGIDYPLQVYRHGVSAGSVMIGDGDRSLMMESDIEFKERAAAPTDPPTSYISLWAKNTNPQELWTTDDNSVDFQITDRSPVKGDYHVPLEAMYDPAAFAGYLTAITGGGVSVPIIWRANVAPGQSQTWCANVTFEVPRGWDSTHTHVPKIGVEARYTTAGINGPDQVDVQMYEFGSATDRITTAAQTVTSAWVWYWFTASTAWIAAGDKVVICLKLSSDNIVGGSDAVVELRGCKFSLS